MSSAAETAVDAHPDVEPAPPEQWYDRSSIHFDAMVTIEGQTEEDFFRYAPETRICEFIDGVVYMPSPVTITHQNLVGFWYFLISGFVPENRASQVVMGPGVYRAAPDRNLEPDLFVAPPGAEPLPPSGLAFGEASLVLEVLSPSNRSHDLNRKAAVYREAEVPEIIFVDGRDKVLIVERLVGDAYETIRLESGRWESSAIEGFWLDVSWLWEDPLPGPFECLNTILGRGPAR